MISDAEKDKIKENFLLEARINFSYIINFINKIDFHPLLKQHAFQNLDQARHWVEDAIVALQVEGSKQVEPLKEEIEEDKKIEL